MSFMPTSKVENMKCLKTSVQLAAQRESASTACGLRIFGARISWGWSLDDLIDG